MAGYNTPGTFCLVVSVVKVVEVDLVGTIFVFDTLSELLELEVVVE